MNNRKLEAIAEKASTDFLALVKESEDKIIEAWAACEEQAEADETNPKYKLSLGITLDLNKDSMLTELTFATRHKFSAVGGIPDPDQVPLPLEES